MTAIAVPGQNITLDKSGLATDTKQDTIIGHIDGVEAALAGLKSDTATLVTQTDGVEGALSTLNAKDFATQTTSAAILSAVDGVEALVTASNVQLGALGKGFFTLPYNELVADYSGATTDVWTSKLASVTQQTMSITYADASKQVITGVVVV
jgi:hypothetical protein